MTVTMYVNYYLCCRAVAFLKLQEYQKAIDDCERALELDPDYSKAYGRLGYETAIDR